MVTRIFCQHSPFSVPSLLLSTKKGKALLQTAAIPSFKGSVTAMINNTMETHHNDGQDNDNSNSNDYDNVIDFLIAKDLRNQLSNMIQDKMNREQYDEAIHQSNAFEDHLNKVLINIIKVRMNARSLKTPLELDQQLKDSETIMEAAPYDPVGYIRAAQVYSLRGKQKNVIQVIEKGIENISTINDDEEDDGLKKMKQLHNDANTRLSIGVDFIARLPYEITSQLLVSYCLSSRVTSRETCLKVSHIWRETALQCRNIWRTLRPSSFTSIDLQVFPKVTQHIEHLTLNTTSFNQNHKLTFKKCVELLGTGDFRSIHKLEINATDYIDTELYYQALTNVSATFRELDMDIGYYGSADNGFLSPQLSRILSACQYLTKIRYCNKGQSGYFVPLSALQHTTQLTEINLQKYYTAHRFKGNELQGLFQASPKLRILIMSGFDDGAFPFIFQYCPELLFLGHSSNLGTRSNFVQAYNKSARQTNTTVPALSISSSFVSRGLLCLDIGNISSGALYVQPFLEAHQQTIQQITIGKNTADDWDFLSVLKMPNLAHLSIYPGNRSLLRHLPSIVRHSPSIEELYIEEFDYPNFGGIEGAHYDNFDPSFTIGEHQNGFTSEMTQSISSSLTNSLTTLCLMQCKLINNQAGFLHMLGCLNKLRNIHLEDCCGTNDRILHAITAIDSLVEVSIFHPDRVSNHGVHMFIQGLAAMPRLEIITLSGIDIWGESFKSVENSVSMKRIDISGSVTGIRRRDLQKIVPNRILINRIGYD